MQLPTQQQFVADCLSKYRWESLPADQKWEEAHFPLPGCLGGDETVMLWAADHTVQGLLQSVELDHRCFYYGANGKDLLNLQTYYPEYLQLFQQLKSKFNSRQGKKTAELKVGVCGRSAEQMTADGKKSGKIGSAITNAQRYQCLVTRHISNAGALSNYQKARGIDTKLRVKLNHTGS